MTRVSTLGNYQSALLDLMSAQSRGLDAQKRVSTQKVATSLEGFGRTSETLTALKSMQSRIQGFMDTGQAVASRLATQALAFDRVADGVIGARNAIAEALAAGRLDGLMLDLQGQFQIVQDGLNAKHQGRYLFAGANSEQAPVTALSLGQLAAAPDVASVFINDGLRSVSRIDTGTSLQTGFLADEIGSDALTIFRDLQQFHTGPDGPIDGHIPDAVRDFLTQKLGELDVAYRHVTDLAARNGSMQNRVDSVMKAHDDQRISIEELVSKRTDADMAKAITDLELSQIAIQASAQVISQLRRVSLLEILRY